LKFTERPTELSNVILYSLISLVSAGFLDIAYKRSTFEPQSRGVFFFTGGLVWVIYQCVFSQLGNNAFRFDETTLIYGMIIGIIATLANISLVESLSKLDVSLGSTIYRLNTIGVVVLSYFFIDEKLGLEKLIGIALGVTSIFIIYNHPKNNLQINYLKLFVSIAIFASILRAVFGVLLKQSIISGAQTDTIMLLTAICWMMGGLLYYLIQEWPSRITLTKVSCGVTAGLLIITVANSLTEALKYGEVSIAAPIANLSFVIALIISILLGMERITIRKIVAIILAVGSVLFLAQAS